MTEIYPIGDAERMKRSLPWLRFAALFFLLGGIAACTVLCFGVTTGNAARRQWTVVLIAVASGWAFLPLRHLAVKPLNARLQHFEGILNETDPAVTREGVFLSAEGRLAIPGSIKPHTKFKCQVYVLTKEEGGRHTQFKDGYRPQFYIRTTDVTGVCHLEYGVQMIMPGDHATMTIELIAPVAMEVGLRFAIREGGRTVGAGNVSEIIE